MFLSRELWPWILAASDSDVERVRAHACRYLLAEAPRAREPQTGPVHPSGTGADVGAAGRRAGRHAAPT